MSKENILWAIGIIIIMILFGMVVLDYQNRQIDIACSKQNYKGWINGTEMYIDCEKP